MAILVTGRWYPRSDFFDINIKYLCIVGLWANDDWSVQQKYFYETYNISLFILAFIFLCITNIGSFGQRDDAILFLAEMDKSVAALNYISKIIIFTLRRKEIRALVYDILDSGDEVPDDKRKLMTWHTFAITGMGLLVLGGFQLISHIQGELVMSAWLPFDPYQSQLSLLSASQVLACLFVLPFMLRAISTQGILCSVIIYLCDQLVDLQKRLKALNYNVDAEVEMRAEFKEIVTKHIRLMRYAKQLKDAFKEYFLVQNLAVTTELCLNSLVVSLVGTKQMQLIITFLSFLFLALFNAYIFCYLGNELMTQSAELSMAAYETNWTSWPVDLQKDLLILITAAQKNFRLSAGGIADMSMQTFAEALYNGYSLFAVLQDMVD